MLFGTYAYSNTLYYMSCTGTSFLSDANWRALLTWWFTLKTYIHGDSLCSISSVDSLLLSNTPTIYVCVLCRVRHPYLCACCECRMHLCRVSVCASLTQRPGPFKSLRKIGKINVAKTTLHNQNELKNTTVTCVL